MSVEAITETTIPAAQLTAIFQQLTKSDITPIWDAVELPYQIRVSRADNSVNRFTRDLDLLAKERLNHSKPSTTPTVELDAEFNPTGKQTFHKGCPCERCDLPTVRWKTVSKVLTIWTPFVNVLDDRERFTAHLSLSGNAPYSTFSEPIEDPGYKLGREMMGALVTSKLSGADPLLMRLYILAKDQRERAALKARETAQPRNVITELANLNAPLDEDADASPIRYFGETVEETSADSGSEASQYFRLLSKNYSDYSSGKSQWPSRPASLEIEPPTGSIISIHDEVAA